MHLYNTEVVDKFLTLEASIKSIVFKKLKVNKQKKQAVNDKKILLMEEN